MRTYLRWGCLGLLPLVGVLGGCNPASQADPPAEGDVPAEVVTNCPTDEAVEGFLADWRAGVPTDVIGVDASIEEALCGQQKLIARLELTHGAPVGYKAGLTSQAGQERFGVNHPVRGVLLDSMLLENGATVSATFGARPLYEADLIVVIGDEAVNDATTPEMVLAHLSEVIPFIELPDLAIPEGVPMNGSVLTAINVGARMGVLGDPIAVERTPEFFQALADMNVRVMDEQGGELATAQGSAVLGHPLNAVLWLIENGVRFRAGEYVSVGSISPLLVPQPGLNVRVVYEGLPGDPTVSVRFQ